MSKHLTSLERESELNAIVMNNDLYEKKCEHFKKQRTAISSMIRQFETGSSQVKRMTIVSEEKRKELKEDVDKQQRKTHSFVQNSIALLNSAFEKVDVIRSNHRTLDFDNPALLITVPYDEWINRAQKKQGKLRSELAALSKANTPLKIEREELKRRSDVTSKAIGKAEKNAFSLREEFQRQELGVANIQKASAANQVKLQHANDEKEMEAKKKAEAAEEIIAAEKVLSDLQKSEQLKEEEEGLLKSKIAVLESLYAKLAASAEFDSQLISELPDDDEINRIVDEWGSFNSARKELIASLPRLDVNVSETDTVDSLQSVLASVTKETTELQREIEQVNIYKKKFIIAEEMMSRKKSGYEAAIKQVENNRNVLNKLKTVASTPKPVAKPTKTRSRQQKEEDALRQLEASNLDIPKGPTYKPTTEDFSTPLHPAENEVRPSGRPAIQVMKQTSMESDFTRPIDSSGPQYPGIQIFSQDTKKTESQAQPSNIVPVNAKANESPSFDDSSIRMDDTGTTQDESMMNGFFSPLKNAPITREPSPVVEFSMADHMNEFNKRQAEKKNASASVKTKRDVSENPFDDDDYDDADSSLIAPQKQPEPVGLSDEEEVEDEDDDDDLWASESQNLDQSAWGSDD